MTKGKIVKWLIAGIAATLLLIGAVGLFLFNKPHRNVQAAAIDYSTESDSIVHEFLTNPAAANEKYLDDSGDSRIIAVHGRVASISKDLKGQYVLVLKSATANVGVGCTFTQETNVHAEEVKPGDLIRVKGVIRAGAGYDADLDIYDDVILEKCDIIKD